MPELPDIPDIDAEAEAFRVALGEELRQARKRLGLSRSAFLAVSGLDIRVPTLASHEHGTRAIGLSQLFMLCRALKTDPIVLLDRVYRKIVGSNSSDTEIRVDLAKLAQTADTRLRPLHAWAQLRLRDRPAGESIEIAFDTNALDSMAGLCQMDRAELIETLLQNDIAARFHEGCHQQWTMTQRHHDSGPTP